MWVLVAGNKAFVNSTGDKAIKGDYPALDINQGPRYPRKHADNNLNGLRAGEGESR